LKKTGARPDPGNPCKPNPILDNSKKSKKCGKIWENTGKLKNLSK
jgi:hypothetical protein